MPTPRSQALWAWRIFFCVGFLFLGVLESFRATFMPAISEALSLSESQLSGLIMVSAVASIILQISAGVWSDRLRPPRLYLIAFMISTGILALSTQINDYPKLLLFYFVIQLGVTLYLLVSNTLIPTLGVRSGRLLTISHGFYGLGAALSPIIAERLLTYTGSWQRSYQLLVYPSLALCLLIIYLSAPTRAITPEETSPLSEARPSLRQLIARPLVWWFAILFGAGITTEVATASWLVYYLCATTQVAQAKAAVYLSGFYVLFTLSRFVAGFILPVGGERRTLHGALISASIILILVVIYPQLSASLLMLSGLALALVFPMMLMMFNESFTQHQTYILGVVISGALLIFMIVNALVVVWSELFSMRTAYLLMVGCALIALGCSVMIKRIHSEIKSQ